MLPSFLLSLREGLEAALIIGIVIGALVKFRRPDLKPAVWWGTAGAVLLSILMALIINAMGARFEGRAEEIFEGTAMLLAAGVLTWMIFWMRGHARGIASDLHARIDRALERSFLALAVVGFVAVAREGFETVLFLLGAETSSASGATVVAGGLGGLVVAAVIGYLFFLGSERIDLRKFFNWTGLLLILFAAGLFAKGIHEFREFFEFEAAWHAAPVWEITTGPLGEGWVHDFLAGLFGWHSSPERIRVVGYFAYLIPVLWFYYRGDTRPLRSKATAAPDAADQVNAGT